MIRIIHLIVALGALACAEGCRSYDAGAGSSPASREFDAQERADSTALATTTDTVLKRRLADLMRRSRALSMDSTARLYAAIPTTPDSALYRIRQALGCQVMILVNRGGSAAYRRATERMRDSLARVGFAFEGHEARMENAGGPPLEFSGGESCGLPQRLVPVPDSLDREVLPARYLTR